MSETVDKRRMTELRSLLRVIEDAGWQYARVEIDGVTLVVSSDADFAASETPPFHPPATAATASEQVSEPEAASVPPEPHAPPAETSRPQSAPSDGPSETVTSPTIGLFWRSPKPGAPPFVEIGDAVAAGETVCIIEVMKLMTHVPAPVDGIVSAIHIENGSMVEHGTALVDIAPRAAEEGTR